MKKKESFTYFHQKKICWIENNKEKEEN